MPEVEQNQMPEKQRRSQAVVRKLRAKVTVNEGDLRDLLAQIQQPLLDAVSEKLASVEKPAAAGCPYRVSGSLPSRSLWRPVFPGLGTLAAIESQRRTK